jgi:small subunit ribosomal protein S23
MVRRIASQVHKQASRLTRAGLLKTLPIWYDAVLEHPPLPLPPREPPSRTSYDSSSLNQDKAFASSTSYNNLSSDQVQDQVFAAMSDDDRSSLKQDQDQALSSAPPPTATAKTTTKKRSTGLRPLPVTYTEDNIRRQFFRDHPFEAFRARSLTEVGTIENEHPIRGLNWTRLNQRGRNPSPEEYVQNYLSAHPQW